MKTWTRLLIISFMLVSVLGVLMRYKIGFEFPFLHQKNLQHAHSHFAFIGWVSQALMVLMLNALKPSLTESKLSQFQSILWANWLIALSMVVSFTAEGYGPISITLSTLSLITGFTFAYLFWSSLSASKSIVQPEWFQASLVMLVLSSFGTLYLVYMMASKDLSQYHYLATVYWYLHFQYNGWFFFALVGLLIQAFHMRSGLTPPRVIYILLVSSAVPAYGLSVLWLELPLYLYIVVVIASIAQMLGWILLINWFIRNGFAFDRGDVSSWVSLFALAACTIKFSLQAASVIPALSQLAFGFRPIVIAYLHLVLLACVSMGIVALLWTEAHLLHSRLSKWAIGFLMAGVFLNEAALALQGGASLSYTLIPGINELLFFISILIFLALMTLVISQFKKVGSSL